MNEIDLQLLLSNSIKTYDEPGKGKKHCPECKKYVGARNATCACGHNFSNDVKPEKEITKFDGAGRGRKQCPSCKQFVGVRTQVCECGNNFSENKPVTVENKYKDSPEITDYNLKYAAALKREFSRIVLTPSGVCVKPSGFEKNQIFDWCDTVVTNGLDKFILYTPEALRYYIRYWVGVNEPDNKKMVKWINEWADNLIGESND